MYSENRHLKYLFVTAVATLSAIFAVISTAVAAGSSSVNVTKSKPGYDKRQRANVHFRNGERYSERMQYKEAAREYEKAIAIDSDYAEAHSNLGYSYRKQGFYDKAVISYKQAIALDSQLAEAYEYLGEAYAEMKQFALAEEQLRKLRHLDPDEAKELEAFIRAEKR